MTDEARLGGAGTGFLETADQHVADDVADPREGLAGVPQVGGVAGQGVPIGGERGRGRIDRLGGVDGQTGQQRAVLLQKLGTGSLVGAEDGLRTGAAASHRGDDLRESAAGQRAGQRVHLVCGDSPDDLVDLALGRVLVGRRRTHGHPHRLEAGPQLLGRLVGDADAGGIDDDQRPGPAELLGVLPEGGDRVRRVDGTLGVAVGEHVPVLRPHGLRGDAEHRNSPGSQVVGSTGRGGGRLEDREAVPIVHQVPADHSVGVHPTPVVGPFVGDLPAVHTAGGVRHAEAGVQPGPSRLKYGGK